jgi:hypothetical protein
VSDRLEEALKHRYIYLPRGTKVDRLGPGKHLGLAIEPVSSMGLEGGVLPNTTHDGWGVRGRATAQF